jgi:hypothetical protein
VPEVTITTIATADTIITIDTWLAAEHRLRSDRLCNDRPRAS